MTSTNRDGLFSCIIGCLAAMIGFVYFVIYGFWNHSVWQYLIVDLSFIFLLSRFSFCFSYIEKNFLPSVIVVLGVVAVQAGGDVKTTIAIVFSAIMIMRAIPSL